MVKRTQNLYNSPTGEFTQLDPKVWESASYEVMTDHVWCSHLFLAKIQSEAAFL